MTPKPEKMTEAEARSLYRIVGSTVERLVRGAWQVVWYCGTEERAKVRLEKSVKQAIEWSMLTPDEQLRKILR